MSPRLGQKVTFLLQQNLHETKPHMITAVNLLEVFIVHNHSVITEWPRGIILSTPQSHDDSTELKKDPHLPTFHVASPHPLIMSTIRVHKHHVSD
ncbi:hypothetical protein Hdeb2414_s0367g00878201 [Helianthus debilis subsp. tardiflorus]